MTRQYFALDLKDEPELIAEYERWHQPTQIWPEVIADLVDAGTKELGIFRCGNRLVMVMDAPDRLASLTPEGRDTNRSAEWEAFMWKFQQSLPFAHPGQKWVPMRCIFSLRETLKARGR